MSAANLNSTLKNLGALFEGQGDGKADLSNLKQLLETSEHVPLDVYFAQLKADLSGEPSPRCDNGKGDERLKRVMSR